MSTQPGDLGDFFKAQKKSKKKGTKKTDGTSTKEGAQADETKKDTEGK